MEKYLIENVDIEDVNFEHVNDDLPRYGEGFFDYEGEKSNWCVYCHINKVNNKMYIGISSNLKDRWSQKGNRYKGCGAIYSAFQKYGWNSFEHIVLMNGLTMKMAGEIEKYLIAKYHTNVETKEGYNIAHGGITGFANFGGAHSRSIPVFQYDLNGIFIQEFDCISDANELCSSSDVRGYGVIFEALSSKKIPFAYGFLWSLEKVDQMEPYYPLDRKYLDEYHKTTVDGGYGRIVQLSKNGELIKIHKSIYHISGDYDVYNQILKCCKGDKKIITYKNYIWLFEKDYTEERVNDILKHNAKVKQRNCNIPVDVYDLNGAFIDTCSSMAEAGIKYSLYSKSISYVCKEKGRRTGNYQFRYHGDPAPGKYVSKHVIQLERPLAQIDPKTNSILNIFTSGMDIKNALNKDKLNITHILACAKGNAKTSYGYIWKFYDEIEKEE